MLTDRAVVTGLCALVLLSTASVGRSQTGVEGWFAGGQAWVVWTETPPQPETYRIYMSADPFDGSIEGAALVGRMFRADWQVERLKLASANLTASVPLPSGKYRRQGLLDGVFAYTPHEPTTAYFAVVKDGESVVDQDNSTGPIEITLEPVRPHLQAQGTLGGRGVRVFAHWVDGRSDWDDQRDDYPVMGNAGFNGTPHVFAVWDPPVGVAEPDGGYPLLAMLHGGDGSYRAFSPIGDPGTLGADRFPGLAVSLDANVYHLSSPGVVRRGLTQWLGYWSGFDRFTPTAGTAVPDDAIVINYIMRRVKWTLEQVAAAEAVDPDRVSIMGHSLGSMGATSLARWQPGTFSASLSLSTLFEGIRFSPLFGRPDQNLATNLPGSPGTRDIFNDALTSFAADGARDRPFMLSVIGRGDENTLGGWDIGKVTNYGSLDGAGYGHRLYWDGRGHSTREWADAFWVASERSLAPTLARFRRDSSFPALALEDQDPGLPGVQPDMGNGDAEDGDPVGAYGAYFDWDDASVVDEPDRWEAVIFAIGLSEFEGDNLASETLRGEVVVRRAQRFTHAPGELIEWTLAYVGSQPHARGLVRVCDDGLVRVPALDIPRDPLRAHIVVRVLRCDADLDLSGAVDRADLSILLGWLARGDARGDLNGDGALDGADIHRFLDRWLFGPCGLVSIPASVDDRPCD